MKSVTLKLLAYCRANDWAGYDPYDALNSKIFKSLPFLDFRLFRLGLTQILKRSPINFRPLLLIPKTQNPKAIALFLMAFLKLKRLGLLKDESLIALMIEKLVNLRSPNNSINPSNLSREMGSLFHRDPNNPSNSTNLSNSYFCWGYSFPWQTRTILVPRGAPNLVCTTFVANALLDAYEYSSKPETPRSSGEALLMPSGSHRPSASSETILQPSASNGELSPSEADLQPATFGALCLNMATSASEYILNELYWEDGNSAASFSYPLPSLRSQTHNANFLGAALLCRVYKHCTEKKFLEPALKVARYSASKQHDDGSWDYGETATQRWVDNFHTGYNLCALRSICQDAETSEFESQIRRGFEFYRKNFFREDGAPKYFHNRTYPIDIHCVAQSISTLLAFKDLHENNVSLAHVVFRWAMTNMWDEQGYFYYQVFSLFKNKISYMRWSQAWILLALATLLEHTEQSINV